MDEWKCMIEAAMRPGVFIADRACGSFVRELELALDAVEVLLSQPQENGAASAAEVHQTVLVGCHLKADEVDDSSGLFDGFAKDVTVRWIAARQRQGADADETVATLLAWLDEDEYGFFSRAEGRIAEALDPQGLEAMERAARLRLNPGDAADSSQAVPSRALLRAIYVVRRDAAAYEAFAEAAGLKPEDALTLAHLTQHDTPEVALGWVERGLALETGAAGRSMSGYDLDHLGRELLIRTGRGAEALDTAWHEFTRYPSGYRYRQLMDLTVDGRQAEWRKRALDACQHADLPVAVEVMVEAGEWTRLAELARARTILKARRSRRYDPAVESICCARDVYLRAELTSEWFAVVAEIRAAHFRKMRFIAGFEAVAAGQDAPKPPSFLERASMRWPANRNGDRE